MKTMNSYLQTLIKNDVCHARMKEILSYPHIVKSTSKFYMYEAAKVNETVMQVL